MYSANLTLVDASATEHTIKEGDPIYVEFSDFPTAGQSFRFEDPEIAWATSEVLAVTYEEDEEFYYVHTQNSTYTLEHLEEFDYEDRHTIEFEFDNDKL